RTISSIGSPDFVISSAWSFLSSSSDCPRWSESRIVLLLPSDSAMPNKVTSAWQPAAIAAPNRIARSACSEPSLQIRNFIIDPFTIQKEPGNHQDVTEELSGGSVLAECQTS